MNTELATVEALPQGLIFEAHPFEETYQYSLMIKTQAKHKSMPSRSDGEEMHAQDDVDQSASMMSAGNGIGQVMAKLSLKMSLRKEHP